MLRRCAILVLLLCPALACQAQTGGVDNANPAQGPPARLRRARYSWLPVLMRTSRTRTSTP